MHAIVVRTGVLAGAALAIATAPAAAQKRQGERPVMPRDAEIALARSAAPPAVSGKARVWVWDGKGYVVADSGTSRVNCYVGRPWVPSVEPHCFDEEGSRTLMPILMRKVELYAEGRSDAEADREIAAGLLSGKYRLPVRPAITYMMSQKQELVNGNGNAVGAWQPHLMIYHPNLTAESVGIPGFVGDLGFVENPGTAFSALVVPLKTFVPVPGAAAAAPKQP